MIVCIRLYYLACECVCTSHSWPCCTQYWIVLSDTLLTEQQQQQQQQPYYTQCNVHTFCIRLKVFMETFYKMFGVMLCRREKCWNRSKMKIVYTSRNISSQLLRLPRACVRSLTIQNEVKCVYCVCVSMYNIFMRAHTMNPFAVSSRKLCSLVRWQRKPICSKQWTWYANCYRGCREGT